MTSVDWDEVKRLAADFQKAQLSFTSQKLSERNCIEIITKLTEAKLLDVIFTNDGKEYVTPQHLAKEVKDELYVHGGRINLVELAKILTVDLSQISKVVSDIEKHDKSIKLILGQLIDKTYISKISEEINDKLALHGYINIADLTLHYNLPADFLQSLIEKALGKSIFGKQDTQDSRIFYTESFVARNKAKIRGALSAITKPTPLSAILGQCTVPDRIFFSILDNLQEFKQVPGVVTGKQGGNSIYVPTIYSKSQSQWVDNFYKQNGYLEYEALTRLGISDPRNFIKRHFPNENLMILNTVAVGPVIIDQIEANIEEAAATNSFLDIYPFLPTVFGSKDIEILLKEVAKKTKTAVRFFNDSIIVSEAFLQNQYKSLEALAEKQAREAVESGKWLQSVTEKKIINNMEIENKLDRKAERRKKASSGKAGGGSQGRETKTKSTKKKYQPNSRAQDVDFEDEISIRSSGKAELNLISIDDIKKELMNNESIAEIEDFAEELATYLQSNLNKYAMTMADQLLQKSSITNLNEVEDRLNVLANNIRIFDKGIKHLDKNAQAPLIKYLLKSLVTDFVNEIFKLAVQQNMLQYSNNWSTESRQKILQLKMPADVKEVLENLHKSLTTDSVDDFLSALEPAMSMCCLVLKKFDKKKERSMILAHREALLEQLNATLEPAVALHLVTDVLFTVATQSALHMSGRHVSSIITLLQSYLESDANLILSKYHDLVLQMLSASDEDTKKKAHTALEEGLPEIKKIANEYKKHLKSDRIQE